MEESCGEPGVKHGVMCESLVQGKLRAVVTSLSYVADTEAITVKKK